jgi:hypothetical protein
MQDRTDKTQRMIRKQVFITREQDSRLKALAQVNGTAAAEEIRRGIELVLEKAAADSDWRNDLKEFLETPSDAWKDRDDMQEFVRELRRSSGKRLVRLGLAQDAMKGESTE